MKRAEASDHIYINNIPVSVSRKGNRMDSNFHANWLMKQMDKMFQKQINSGRADDWTGSDVKDWLTAYRIAHDIRRKAVGDSKDLPGINEHDDQVNEAVAKLFGRLEPSVRKEIKAFHEDEFEANLENVTEIERETVDVDGEGTE